MNGSGAERMHRSRKLLLGVVLFTGYPGIVVGEGGGHGAAGEPKGERASGQQVYIDPKTGRIIRDPSVMPRLVPMSPETVEATRRSHAGLVEEPLPAGGATVDLQGRFQSLSVITTGADGEIEQRCVSPAGVHDHGGHP